MIKIVFIAMPLHPCESPRLHRDGRALEASDAVDLTVLTYTMAS